MEKALFRFAIENASELILFFDDNGMILYANPSAEQQLEYDDYLDRFWMADVIPGEFRTGNGYIKPGSPKEGVYQDMMMYRGNRTCFPAKVKILCYGQDENRFYVCMAKNMSNEKLLEKVANKAGQEVEEAEKVKTEFVANVTHELRTPVNGILGNVRELISGETDKAKLKLLGLVERGCRDMNAIINNILDFSKLEAGKFTLEAQKFNFRSMIEYVEGNHRNRITEKGLEFTISVLPGIPEYIVGDELRIVQILNNLISNAYKFTSVGGINVEVVKTAQRGKRMELFFMVIDSGIGIAEADQSKLFKSFSQVDASISRKFGGTGLGLNITKQLVELMNGNIHVQSEYGKGTVFSFNIWVEVPEEECLGDMAAAETTDSSGFSKQTLLEKLTNLTETASGDKVWKYGEKENKEELEKKLSKLILSMEMENWEKAESFAETVKQLLEEAPREIKSTGLRIKMAVQKGDYDKAMASVELLRNMMGESYDG